MKKIKLGYDGPEVSVICLGAMRFGTKTAEDISFRLMDEYLEKGGNFIDTANVYAAWEPGGKGGESETVIGKWMKIRNNRDRVIIATKMGSRFQITGFGLSQSQIKQEIDASLKRLQTDYVDILYAHFDDRNVPVEEVMGTFNELIKIGKVRWIGASNFMTWRLEEYRNVCLRENFKWFVCIQQRYSYFQPVIKSDFGPQVAASDELLDYCRVRGLKLLAYSPLLGGCYSRQDRKIPGPYVSAINEERLRRLRTLCSAKGVSENVIVLAWMINSKYPVIPIVGVSSSEQLKENLSAVEIILSEEEIKILDS